MQISKKDWNKYSDRQEQIRKKAAELMLKWIEENGTDDRDAMIEFANYLVLRYGEAAAAYACQMYDAIAEAQGADVLPAEPAELAKYSDVAKVVNGALLGSIAGLLVARAVERLVKQSGADTMLVNAYRDRAEFAWIPDGNACPYCLEIAAEGWKYASAKMTNGGHAEHIHASCNCEFAIRFDKKSNVSGYDPKKYQEELAEKSEKEIRAEQREENRELIDEQKREAYAFNREVIEKSE